MTYDLRVDDFGLQVLHDVLGCVRFWPELQTAEDKDRAELALRVLLLHYLEVVLGQFLQALEVLRVLQHDLAKQLVRLARQSCEAVKNAASWAFQN